MDFHQINLQLHLFNSLLPFNLTLRFCWITFDRTLFFSKHLPLLKAKLFSCLKTLPCISASSWGPSKELLSLLYKNFLGPFLNYASLRWFLFFYDTKLERFHRAPSRAITIASHHVALSLPLFHLSFHLKLSGSSVRICFLSPFLLSS